MRSYRRRLPHFDVAGVPVFVTWRLAGSLPRGRVFGPETCDSRAAFLAMERMLDEARWGPVLLQSPKLATLVRDEILQAAADALCRLDAYVVMPNHVHVLWIPSASSTAVVQHVKWASALMANRALGRRGVPLWQSEYFYRVVRQRDGVAQVRRYIEWNPVKAGLVRAPEEYLWSSASGVGPGVVGAGGRNW